MRIPITVIQLMKKGSIDIYNIPWAWGFGWIIISLRKRPAGCKTTYSYTKHNNIINIVWNKSNTIIQLVYRNKLSIHGEVLFRTEWEVQRIPIGMIAASEPPQSITSCQNMMQIRDLQQSTLKKKIVENLWYHGEW